MLFTQNHLYRLARNSLLALLCTGILSAHAQQLPEVPPPVVKLSPQVRASKPLDVSIPTLAPGVIEPFLAEMLIVDPANFAKMARIVATQEGRVLLSQGDRAYARGGYSGKEGADAGAMLSLDRGQPRDFRVFRNATPVADPTTGDVLGYEAQYIGKAQLVRGEGRTPLVDKSGDTHYEVTPATLDIVSAKEEIRVGDRLVPEPARQLLRYTPHAPKETVAGQIAATYANNATLAGANQVVVINRGSRDGLESGHVLALLKKAERVKDRTDNAKPTLLLPTERNGLLMVFRTFERLSYALVLQITDGVRVGDRVGNPN